MAVRPDRGGRPGGRWGHTRRRRPRRRAALGARATATVPFDPPSTTSPAPVGPRQAIHSVVAGLGPPTTSRGLRPAGFRWRRPNAGQDDYANTELSECI